MDTSANFYQEIYTLKGHIWGQKASELAIEASAIIRSALGTRSRGLRVLDLGSGDGRDTLFFAHQGWLVTAVDSSSSALEILEREAKEQGLDNKVDTLCCDLNRLEMLPFDEPYDLVFSNYCLHFVLPENRPRLFEKIQSITSQNGFNVFLAIKDFNEEYVGDIDQYRYLKSKELLRAYSDWNILDYYEGNIPDSHPGHPDHEHCVSCLVAKKANGKIIKDNKVQISLVIILTLSILSILSTALSYESRGSIAAMWPAAIYQHILAIAYGGWGILAVVFSGVVTNAINIGSAVSMVGFIPANFIQSFIPGYYYRKIQKSGGWNKDKFSFIRFFGMAVLVPNTLGALWGAAVLVNTGVSQDYWGSFLNWTLANIPIATALGWPLFVTLFKELVQEGFVFNGWWK
jgi:tellurite methyltransferase